MSVDNYALNVQQSAAKQFSFSKRDTALFALVCGGLIPSLSLASIPRCLVSKVILSISCHDISLDSTKPIFHICFISQINSQNSHIQEKMRSQIISYRSRSLVIYQLLRFETPSSVSPEKKNTFCQLCSNPKNSKSDIQLDVLAMAQ